MLAPVTLREESALESAPDLDATKNREKEKMKLPSRTTGKMSERGVEIYSEYERGEECLAACLSGCWLPENQRKLSWLVRSVGFCSAVLVLLAFFWCFWRFLL